jgi:hypothetical protein
MQPTERVGEQLNRAKMFHNFVIEEYPKGTYKGTLRNRLFIALCDLELEHHGAVLTLVDSAQHNGSALALLRPIAETCHRAFWTLYCANEQRIPLIVGGTKQFPEFAACRVAVEKHFADQKHGGIFTMSHGYAAQLHGLTHTGMEQLQFRFDGEFNSRPTYPDKQICTLLQQATMWLAMTAIAHMQLIEGTEHVLSPNTDRITNKYIQLFGAG